jgi:hypothetical protein
MLAWKDQWQGNILRTSFPKLFSYVKKQNMSLQQMLHADFASLFHLPLSEPAFHQYTQLQDMLQTLSISTNGHISGALKNTQWQKLTIRYNWSYESTPCLWLALEIFMPNET